MSETTIRLEVTVPGRPGESEPLARLGALFAEWMVEIYATTPNASLIEVSTTVQPDETRSPLEIAFGLLDEDGHGVDDS